MTKKFCDIAKFFRQWIHAAGCLDDPTRIVQTSSVAGCERPLIWYSQVDEDPPECLDPMPIYIPSRVALDVEIIAESQEQVELMAGALKQAVISHSRMTPHFDFDGCCVCRMRVTDHDANYVAKAPGLSQGDFGVGVFVELYI